jgi:glutathione S-transferase
MFNAIGMGIGFMKLYITTTSPYARLARIAVIEKGLTDKVELVEAKTRTPGSPYYSINPSGRVPCLVRDDGQIMEDSQLICAWLDALDGKPRLMPAYRAGDWAYGRLECHARSMLDGMAVWSREVRRPDGERSSGIVQHEVDRALRMADSWEAEVGHPLMQGPLNMAQMLLIAAIDMAAHRGMGDLTGNRAKLAVWARRVRQMPSVQATLPPGV